MTGQSTSSNDAHLPLRVLLAIANPADLPPFDPALWQEISTSLSPFIAKGLLVLERLENATETALRHALARDTWHVLHLFAHSEARPLAQYGTIALQSLNGTARNVTEGYLTNLVTSRPSIRLVVLQSLASTRFFAATLEVMAQHGLAAITVSSISAKTQRAFVTRLYAGLLEGRSARNIFQELIVAVTEEDTGAVVRLQSQDELKPVFTTASGKAEIITEATSSGTIAGSAVQVQREMISNLAQQVLKRKRASGQFDVFLCHNSIDTVAVQKIGRGLEEAGVLPWLDVSELPPGRPWQQLVEQQIENIHSAAVFVGKEGIGPWQRQEMDAILEEFIRQDLPVIPVILPGTPSVPKLPLFLKSRGWVDFRIDHPDPLEKLIWGITHKRPGE